MADKVVKLTENFITPQNCISLQLPMVDNPVFRNTYWILCGKASQGDRIPDSLVRLKKDLHPGNGSADMKNFF